MKINTLIVSIVACCSLVSGCDKQPKQDIQPAKKLSSDASIVAKQAWDLINQLDKILYAGDNSNLDSRVSEPARALANQWRIDVKMTDAVAEGKYALCRKSLNSLDEWARSIEATKNASVKKRNEYEHDKALCKDAIENPELGNSSAQV